MPYIIFNILNIVYLGPAQLNVEPFISKTKFIKLSNSSNTRKARVKRRTLHEPNSMQMT